MTRRLRRRGESGVSLVEMMIAMALLSVVVVAVDSSLSVVQKHQVQVANGTAALDNIQTAQEVITRDIHAATAWTTPAVPTSVPAQPVTAQTLVFTALLNSASGTVTVALNTTTHVLTVTCADISSDKACGGPAGGTQTQAKVANIDSSSLFTMTTDEVSQTINSVTTHTFFFTSVASTLVVDSPSVGAVNMSQTTLSSPALVTYNIVYGCETSADEEGASGTC
jgi:prepilin-type N-terminal cleavage/methylation domain-containing protein